MAAGYVNACGTPEARAAIAKYHSTSSAEDVIVANGASGALELALTALLDVCIKCVFECVNVIDLKNSNIVYMQIQFHYVIYLQEGSILLVPRPGFPCTKSLPKVTAHQCCITMYCRIKDGNAIWITWNPSYKRVERIYQRG